MAKVWKIIKAILGGIFKVLGVILSIVAPKTKDNLRRLNDQMHLR